MESTRLEPGKRTERSRFVFGEIDDGRNISDNLCRMIGLPKRLWGSSPLWEGSTVVEPTTPIVESIAPPLELTAHVIAPAFPSDITLESVRTKAAARQKIFYDRNKTHILADRKEGYRLMKAQRDSEVPDAICNPVIRAEPPGDGGLFPPTPATVIKPRAASAPKRTPLKKVESVYLVQEREFIKSGESIYKIGRTCQNHTARFSQYPKGSALLLQRACIDCRNVESQIKALFKAKYLQNRDIGVEYFSGDAAEMIRDINCLVDAESIAEPARESAPEVVADKPYSRERQRKPSPIIASSLSPPIGRI